MRRVSPEVFVFLAAWLGVSIIFQARALSDPGSLWHIRIGDRILSHGLMTTDPHTFTFANWFWIPQQWLGECVMSLVHRVAGFDSLLLAFSVSVAAVAAWMVRRLRTAGMGLPLAVAVVGLSLVSAGFHFYIRPHLVTMFGITVVMVMLIEYDRERITARQLAWLIPFFWLWANCHGGVLGGYGTFGLAILSWMLSRGWMRWREVLILSACVGVLFVNPFGADLPRFWFRIVSSTTIREVFAEHSPLNLARSGDQAVLAFGILYLVVVLGTVPKRPRMLWLLPIVWFALTVRSIRQGPLFVLTALVVIADCWPHTRWHRYLLTTGDTLARDEREPLPTVHGWWVAIVLVLTAIVAQSIGVRVPIVGRGWAKLPETLVPVELTTALQEYAASVPEGTPIYNDPNFGGFVVYHAPKLKIFADDRFELYGDEWLTEYIRVINTDLPMFDTWQRRHGFERAIVSVQEPMVPLEAHLVSKGWSCIIRGPLAAMYARP